MQYKRVVLAAVVGLLSACGPSPPSSDSATFEHDLPPGATPWSHDRFDDTKGKFTFAVFSDLNGGEREGVFEVAIAQLSLLRPELIIGLGDLIHGGTEDRERLAKEWDHFDQRANQSVAPVFYVGGNHDLTNQMMRDVWTERYGARYYHFVYKKVLFLILDTEDYEAHRMQEIYLARDAYIDVADGNRPGVATEMEYYRMPERLTGEIGSEQSVYFQEAIAEHPDVLWTFLFMHKPVWRRDDEPEFAAIESALADRQFTVFSAHFHAYSHTVRNGRDYIHLGTTGGAQNAENPMSFDHVTLVTMAEDRPTIANLKLEGILDETGRIPLGGDDLCFQASNCDSKNR